MNNEAQEKEIPVGTETFSENDEFVAWFECGVVPDRANSNNIVYTKHHMNQIIKWLTEKIFDGHGYIQLLDKLYDFNDQIDMDKVVAVITNMQYDKDIVKIGIKPYRPEHVRLFKNYKDKYKLTSLFTASLVEMDGYSMVSEEDSELKFFFLHEN